MKNKSKFLLPLTLVVGFVSTVVGALVFAKNKKVQKFVKESSGKLFDEVNNLVGKAKSKVDASDVKDDKFKEFLSSTLNEISKKLDSVDKKTIDKTFDNLASNINNIVGKFEDLKETQVDPAVQSAVDSLKEAREKIMQSKK